MGGAFADFLAAGPAHLRHTVAYPAQSGAAETLVKPALAGPAHVTVATGLRQRMAAEQQPRTDQPALLDGFGQTVVGAAGIAHRGKAAQQHGLQQLAGAHRGIAGRPVPQGGEIGGGGSDVDMRVAQARHQHLAPQVEHLRRRLGRRALAHFHDAPGPHPHAVLGEQFADHGVQHQGIGEQNISHDATPRYSLRVSAPSGAAPGRAGHRSGRRPATRSDR